MSECFEEARESLSELCFSHLHPRPLTHRMVPNDFSGLTRAMWSRETLNTRMVHRNVRHKDSEVSKLPY